MKITINGKPEELEGSPDLFQAVSDLVKAEKGIIVQVNEKLIKRSDWTTYFLKEGDAVDVIHFVGGG